MYTLTPGLWTLLWTVELPQIRLADSGWWNPRDMLLVLLSHTQRGSGMPYFPAERGTYQQRRKRITNPIDTGGLATTYDAPYFDLVVFWDVDPEAEIPVVAVTIGDLNGDMHKDIDVWYGDVTTLLPSDARVVR